MLYPEAAQRKALRGCPIYLFRPGGVTLPLTLKRRHGACWQITGWLRRIQCRLLDAKADIAHVAE